jgi:alpha-ketoglutarate-dependent taurine dioxygenase
MSSNGNGRQVGIYHEELSGADFLDAEVATSCLAELDQFGVVVYRGADVSDEELVAFSRLLGDVVTAPVGGLTDHPEISPVSLDPARSELAAYRRSTFFWHIDGTNDEIPQKASLLAAREIAEEGGDTEFASTYAAYDALPEEDKAHLAGLRAVHSMAASQLLIDPEPTPKQRAAWDRVPSREHQLVWTRPDGRKSLLIGATTNEIAGLTPEESKALLDRLLEWCTQKPFVLRHPWRVGDLVIWDNTGMLHRALPYEPTSRRLLHRTTLSGELAVR